jgi:hypothetical protein
MASSKSSLVSKCCACAYIEYLAGIFSWAVDCTMPLLLLLLPTLLAPSPTILNPFPSFAVEGHRKVADQYQQHGFLATEPGGKRAVVCACIATPVPTHYFFPCPHTLQYRQVARLSLRTIICYSHRKQKFFILGK